MKNPFAIVNPFPPKSVAYETELQIRESYHRHVEQIGAEDARLPIIFEILNDLNAILSFPRSVEGMMYAVAIAPHEGILTQIVERCMIHYGFNDTQQFEEDFSWESKILTNPLLW